MQVKHLSLFIILFLGSFSIAQEINFDNLAKILRENDQLKGSVCLRKEGKVIYTHHFDKDAKDQVYRYHIGSISKTFTASLVFIAIEEGKLSLDTKLTQWYPSIGNDSISIDLMLSHRSGLHNFTNDASYPQFLDQEQSEADMIARFSIMDLDFSPGSKQEYSNTNYVLLSYILQKVYNKTYSEILQEKICAKLNLSNTYYSGTKAKDEWERKSYYYSGKWIESSKTHPSIPLGAGGIVSSPQDLTVFFTALLEGKLVSEQSLNLMKVDQGLGKGLMAFPFYEHKAYGHNGGIDGFQSHASYFPDEKLSVAVCLNGSQYPLNDLLIDLLSIYWKRKDYELPVFTEIDVKLAQLMEYKGLYRSSNFPLDIEVFIEGDQLKAKATNQAAFPLKAIDKHVFEFKAAGIKMTFNPEANTMAFEQYNMKIPFKR